MAIKVKRKIRDPEEIPLASTADIAFLLIIFYLAASALMEIKGIKMPVPKKDTPPLQIESKNLFKLEIDKNKNFIYENQIYSIKEIFQKMEQANQINSEIVFAIKIHPDCPSEIVPLLIDNLEKRNLYRFSITLKK